MDNLVLIKQRIEESINSKKDFLEETENISKAADAIVKSLYYNKSLANFNKNESCTAPTTCPSCSIILLATVPD